jgi:hypothetical protein
MVSTVWALFRSAIRRNLRRVTRGMRRAVSRRGGQRYSGVGMTGGQADLRAMQEKRHEEERRRPDGADPTDHRHVTRHLMPSYRSGAVHVVRPLVRASFLLPRVFALVWQSPLSAKGLPVCLPVAGPCRASFQTRDR